MKEQIVGHDTYIGVNRDAAHFQYRIEDRLVAEAIAWDDHWGTHDGTIHGHGTQMAGTALYGNLTPLLTSADAIELTHRVESVKVVPDENNDPPEIEQYGHIFHQSALKAEKEFPERARIFCCAVSDESGLRGMPTEWSSQIDNDSADRTHRRLFVVSGGNLDYEGSVIYAHEYPDRNDTTELCAPAQAWNALTVGAYTALQDIKHPDYSGYRPLAASGALCPQSRTSVLWDRQWPIKPDIVLEGGNFATQAGNPHATTIDDRQLLSTNADFLTSISRLKWERSVCAVPLTRTGSGVTLLFNDPPRRGIPLLAKCALGL